MALAPEDLVRKWMPPWWNDKADWPLEKYIHPNAVMFDINAKEAIRGFDGVRGFRQILVTAFPDLLLWIDDAFSEGPRVPYESLARGHIEDRFWECRQPQHP